MWTVFTDEYHDVFCPDNKNIAVSTIYFCKAKIPRASTFESRPKKVYFRIEWKCSPGSSVNLLSEIWGKVCEPYLDNKNIEWHEVSL